VKGKNVLKRMLILWHKRPRTIALSRAAKKYFNRFIVFIILLNLSHFSFEPGETVDLTDACASHLHFLPHQRVCVCVFVCVCVCVCVRVRVTMCIYKRYSM